jgi:uncharacterized membrane protein YfcA
MGAIIGLSSGMFGIGGALLATPLLKIFMGVPAILALATPLVAAVPSAVSGSIAYARTKLVRYDVAWRTLPVAMPLNLLGAYLTKYTPDLVLMVATGAVLLYVAWTFIRRGFRKVDPAGEPSIEEGRFGWQAYVGCGIAGFMSGFLAIGGGIALVPTFIKVLHLPTKQAVATSLLCVAALAVPGVIMHGILHHIDWHIALLLCITVIPMSYLGARIATKMKNSTLERVYGIAMMAFALYFIFKNLNP